MKTIVSDLVAKYSWDDLEHLLPVLYPTPRHHAAEYREAYQKLVSTLAIQTNMRIVIEKNGYSGFGNWHEVYGKNGTLVKEEFRSERAHQLLKDRWESEQGYALSYTDWAEIAGMAIDPDTFSVYTEKEIVVHVLMMITAQWRSDEQNLKVLEELKTISEGQEQDLMQKDMTGSSGFRQIWSEKENGEFHGFYAVYWENGTMEQRGIMVDGNKEGVWTYWDKNGKIERQVRYWCDREVEIKSEGPWRDYMEDQNIT